MRLKVQQHQLPEEEGGHKQGVGLQQLHLHNPRAHEEAQVVQIFFHHSNLKSTYFISRYVVLHGVCDNQTLSIMGQHCPVVQHLDITGEDFSRRFLTLGAVFTPHPTHTHSWTII